LEHAFETEVAIQADFGEGVGCVVVRKIKCDLECGVAGGLPEFEFIKDGGFGILIGAGAVCSTVVEDDVLKAIVGFGKRDVGDDDSRGKSRRAVAAMPRFHQAPSLAGLSWMARWL
jgi:hypothetical protein